MADYASSSSSTTESPLLQNEAVHGLIIDDGKSRSAGGWRAASFVLGAEFAERLGYYGINSNLITYLTGPLGQSTAVAASNVNAFFGAASLLPLLGAFIADSFLGRYCTIIISSLLYIVGLGLLTSSAIVTSLRTKSCGTSDDAEQCSPSQANVIFFFVSLYLVTVAQGGHRPCVQAFGADQFDAEDPEECKAKSSYFNWFNFTLSTASMVAFLVLSYVQDNINWGLGFGIPCVSMCISLLIYLVGNETYRFSINTDEKHTYTRVDQLLVKSIRNWRMNSSAVSLDLEASSNIRGDREARAVLRLVPIAASCLVYAIVIGQSPTLFTKQGVTLNRSIGSNFQIPPAALQIFITLAVIVCITIYDRVLVPIARAITGKPSGITMLQRVGVGIFLSIICMLIAALVEMKRLGTALQYGLVDKPEATIPMSFWWLVPQYVLIGIADVFTMVGLQEFFYNQVPKGLKSIGLALNISIFGIGYLLSSLLISIIEKATSSNGRDGWFSDNLNRAHLDYFYWLLGGLSALASIAFFCFTKSFVYDQGHTG